MITKRENLSTVVKKQLKDGIGNTTILNITDQEGLNDKGRLFASFSLEPGSSIGKHTHVDESEIYFILEGKGLVYDNGKEETVTSGDVVITKSGETHSIKNVGETTLNFIALIVLD
ncbi:cupin [Vallitalea longa]|uniref:Cupin n=1 Tax=Vallitalea longa TaxID=2936439 RepID=A0A9W5Y938_9FIRM|nr:cupin domain-containing protein [Vallitalea longa]GKX28341.1 cupin [Vallitalea longa]